MYINLSTSQPFLNNKDPLMSKSEELLKKPYINYNDEESKRENDNMTSQRMSFITRYGSTNLLMNKT